MGSPGESCTQLDLELAKESDGMDGNTFERYGKALHKAAVLREQLKVEQQHLVVVCNLATYLMLNLPNPAGDPSVAEALGEVATFRQTIKTTV